MHYKIASIILNSAKATGLSDVFVAQPDSVKENLAGKIFILAEIGGKKSEGRKIFDFLILALTDNYYNDEKILFRDKIEGLKLENIFEAAVAKTNKNLLDFLAAEKIRINPEATSITLGVVCDNKLFFSNFGRNRALLVYRHGENYELINVEANASEAPEINQENAVAKTPQLFSSVISGEVPTASYFVFTSEALPEYLSGPEMISIVTKLPPMTAAEQIKNVLSKINTYVPFLGIIIKNTTGLTQIEGRGDLEDDPSSAHNSISSLNYTEQKTEQILSPAGLINLPKLFTQAKQIISDWLIPSAPATGKKVIYKNKSENTNTKSNQDNNLPTDLGKINSLKEIRQDSFLIKDKMFFKKKSSWLLSSFNKFIASLINWLDPRRWSLILKSLKSWLLNLNKKNKILFGILGTVIVLFVASTYYISWNTEQAALDEQFRRQIAQLEEMEGQIDSYLLYNDQAAANRTISEAMKIIEALPRDTDEQNKEFDRLSNQFSESQNKIYKIKKIDQATMVNDLNGLDVQNLVFADGKLTATSKNVVYEIKPNSSDTVKTTIDGADNLSLPYSVGNLIYFWDNDRVIQFNTNTKKSTIRSFSQPPNHEFTGFSIYQNNNNLYTINKQNNQIFRYSSGGGNFGAKTDWLGQSVDLSLAADLFVDGDIYILNQNGRVMKFRLNKPLEYGSTPLAPEMSEANKFIVGDKKIYLFDAPSKRLAVLDKANGSLLQQYQVEALSNPSDFTVDEANNKAYFLNSSLVYEVEIN